MHPACMLRRRRCDAVVLAAGPTLNSPERSFKPSLMVSGTSGMAGRLEWYPVRIGVVLPVNLIGIPGRTVVVVVSVILRYAAGCGVLVAGVGG